MLESDRNMSTNIDVELYVQDLSRNTHSYSVTRCKHWLSWLAKEMQKNNQDEFRIENLQSKWLPTTEWVAVYNVLIFFCLLLICIFLVVCINLDPQVTWNHGRDFALLLTFILIFPKRLLDVFKISEMVFSPVWVAIGIAWSYGVRNILRNLEIQQSLWFLIGLGALTLAIFTSKNLNYIVIRDSGKSIYVSGLNAIVSLLVILVVFLYYGWSIHGVNGLIQGTRIGLFLGICIGLGLGGEIYLKHYILRLCLWISGCTPWNYTLFLNSATRSKLLINESGSYKFINSFFKDYFVSLESDVR